MNIPNTGEAAHQMRTAMESKDKNESNRDDEELNHFNAVSKMYIKDETRAGYNSLNMTLLIWLVGNHPACVKVDVKETLQMLSGKELLRESQKSVSNANENEKPIIFEGLTVRIFVEFLHYRARIKKQIFLSKSGCGSYRSALKELYRQCGERMSSEFESDLSVKFKGMMRGHAREKQETGGRLAEGKDPMSFSLYRLLCKRMMRDETKESVFAHAFLTLTWNLVCRSKNIVNIHRNHLSWVNDCLSIKFAHTKTDVEGGDQARVRHVYANPHDPDICAILALAKYLLLFEPKESGMLFDNKSYQRFQKYLSNLVRSCKEEVER